MRLTKRKAVEITKELWEWLAETGNKKWNWPKMSEYERFDNDCPLCEYTLRHNNPSCKYCPLKEMWTGGLVDSCMNLNSPYYQWTETFDLEPAPDATVTRRKQYAQMIVELCNQWLKEHKK